MDPHGKVILVCGEDEFFIRRKSRELADSLAPDKDREFGMEVIDGEAGNVSEARTILRQTLDALQTYGFFGGEKLVWLKNADFLGNTRIGETKTVKDSLVDLNQWITDSKNQSNRLLVDAMGLNRQSALYKRSKKLGEVFDFAVGARPFEQRAYAGERVGEKAKELGLVMPESVRAAFLDRIGYETRRVFSELDKLKTYLGNRSDVKIEDIREITSPGEIDAIWDFADALGSRDIRTALKTLRRLLDQRVAPIAICSNLEARMHEWLLFREALDRKWARLSGSGRFAKLAWASLSPETEAFLSTLRQDPRRMAPFRASRCAACASNYSLPELRRAGKRLIRLREALVSTGVDPETLLEIALMRIIRGRAAR